MDALVKWIGDDPVFDALGLLIAGTGVLVLIFMILLLYSCGLLA